jgi:hypothetical protein
MGGELAVCTLGLAYKVSSALVFNKLSQLPDRGCRYAVSERWVLCAGVGCCIIYQWVGFEGFGRAARVKGVGKGSTYLELSQIYRGNVEAVLLRDADPLNCYSAPLGLSIGKAWEPDS